MLLFCSPFMTYLFDLTWLWYSYRRCKNANNNLIWIFEVMSSLPLIKTIVHICSYYLWNNRQVYLLVIWLKGDVMFAICWRNILFSSPKVFNLMFCSNTRFSREASLDSKSALAQFRNTALKTNTWDMANILKCKNCAGLLYCTHLYTQQNTKKMEQIRTTYHETNSVT